MAYKSYHTEIEQFKGLTFTKIENSANEEIIFTTETACYYMKHDQDCCKSVSIDDIEGELEDLVGTPILVAEEVNSDDEPFKRDELGSVPDSFTWTFYKLATVKGYVTIKWYGESNGYYSESVSINKVM